jgi:type IV secretory pathway VirB3-like protein
VFISVCVCVITIMMHLIRRSVQEDEDMSTDVILNEIDLENEVIDTNTTSIIALPDNSIKY